MRWDVQTGDLKVLTHADASDKPKGYLDRDRGNWKNVIASVEDDDLRTHMQTALDEGNEDLLDTLILEATFKP